MDTWNSLLRAFDNAEWRMDVGQEAMILFSQSLEKMSPEFITEKMQNGRKEYGGEFRLDNINFDFEIDCETADLIGYTAMRRLGFMLPDELTSFVQKYGG